MRQESFNTEAIIKVHKYNFLTKMGRSLITKQTYEREKYIIILALLKLASELFQDMRSKKVSKGLGSIIMENNEYLLDVLDLDPK